MDNEGKFIAVIGGSDCSAREAQLAEEVGRELAQQGAIVLCGGLGGIMEAVCRGASSAGGITVGILPGNDRREANPHVRIPLVTGLGEARNVVLVKSAQAIIAIAGGYGTLSEIGHALRNGIPVIGLNTWTFSTGKQADSSIIRVKTAAEAAELALTLASG